MSDADAPSPPADRGRVEPLLSLPACSLMRELACGRDLHLVGGALRDALLCEPFRDLDVIVDGWGRELAHTLADRWGARAVALGGDRFAAFRVAAPATQLDIWDRTGTTLEADLQRRDFTIHSFAVDLATSEMIDPFAGLVDLADRRLRMTTSASFVDDPLRVLRLGRFVAQLGGFSVDRATLCSARESVRALRGLPKERMRIEIQLTLECPRAATGIDLWVELGVLPAVLPGIPVSRPQRAQLRRQLEAAFERLKTIGSVFEIDLDRAVTHLAVVLMVVEGQDRLPAVTSLNRLSEGGLITKAFARRLRRVVAHRQPPTSPAEQRWWLHRMGRLWASALAAAVAVGEPDSSAELPQPWSAVAELAHTEGERIFDPPWLVDGDDLIESLAIEPGPALGRLLERVRKWQIENDVDDRKRALTLAAHLAADRHTV